MRPPRCLRWFIWKYIVLVEKLVISTCSNELIPNETYFFNCCCWSLIDSIVQNPNEFDPKTKEGIPNWATYRIIELSVIFRYTGLIVGWCFFSQTHFLKKSLGKEWSFWSWNHDFSSSSAPLWSFDHAKATKARIKLKLRSSRSIWLEHCFASVVFQELTVWKFSEKKKTTPDPISRKFIFHEVYEDLRTSRILLFISIHSIMSCFFSHTERTHACKIVHLLGHESTSHQQKPYFYHCWRTKSVKQVENGVVHLVPFKVLLPVHPFAAGIPEFFAHIITRVFHLKIDRFTIQI